MKNFRGRITRTDANNYVIDDSDSETDSEVEAVYSAGNFEIFIDGDLLEDDGTTDTSGSEDEDIEGIINFGGTVDDDLEESENIALEGYFAFGGRLRSRRWRNSQDSFELSFPPRSPLSTPPLGNPEGGSEGNESEEGYLRSNIPTPMWEGGATPTYDERLDFSNSESDAESITVNINNSNGSKEIKEGNMVALTTNDVPQPVIDNAIAMSSTDPRNAKQNQYSTTPSTSKSEIKETKKLTETIGSEIEMANKSISLKSNTDKDNVSESGESGRTDDIHSDKEEETCNPMVSDAEEFDENDDALRGDRIGSTTYSERHVLKILIKWVQELPKYSENRIKDKSETKPHSSSSSTSTVAVDKTRFLETDFEEDMALLWDMSFEPDVMNFLVQQNVFNIIRETIDISQCSRLTEVGLGIMANIISQQSILEDFSIHDASLKLVEGILSIAIKMPKVPVLIQVFAVLRRITWFLHHVAVVQNWMDLLISPTFLNCSNFIMSSSTNALLLGNVIITLFSILETLSPETEKESGISDDEDQSVVVESSCFFGKALQEKKDFENFRPFCETNYVQSLCEGLEELMKNPKPRKVQKLTSTRDDYNVSTDEGFDGATEERNLDDLEIQIPDGLVQNAIINGLSSFYILYKTPNGKESIRNFHFVVLNFLLNFIQKFTLCTDALSDSSSLDYYAITINLLSFCHKELGELSSEAVFIPVALGSKLMDNEEEVQTRIQIKDGAEHDSRTFIALVVHEYMAGLADIFGQERITAAKNMESKLLKYRNFFTVVDKLVNEVSAKYDDSDQNLRTA